MAWTVSDGYRFLVRTVSMDPALEKSYNKPVKSQSGIIGISSRKEAVATWNIIKQDKNKFGTFLYELCNLDEEDIWYLLHHEFSNAITNTNTHCISLDINYMNQRQPFKFSNKNGLAYIAGKS